MTQMLIRVLDAREAEIAARARVDAIELVVAEERDLTMARAARQAFPGRLRLRIEEPTLAFDFVAGAAEVSADEIAVAHDHAFAPLPPPEAELPLPLRYVAILGADIGRDALPHLGKRFGAVVLETHPPERLIDSTGIAALHAFASACRANGLAFGLSGGLEAPDVARLLLLEPDVLAFDTAVRRDHAPNGTLDPAALDAIRALVPLEPQPRRQEAVSKVIDRVFLRDFEVELEIGAYHAERGRSQRVRFSVTADVVRVPGPPRDMRDVFSYDVIIETIRVLAERAHVTFVETLADEVAASLLSHAEVVAVEVKVEKLDVVAGAVGIEIVRRRETS